MRELRTCPVTGRTVLLNDAWIDAPAPPQPPPATCWYCAPRGPVITLAEPVRAVPHPTPWLGIEGDARPGVSGGAVRRDAVGAHELVYGAHAEDEGALMRMVAARVADLRNDTRLRGFGAVRRITAGAHAAWQVFALPFDLPLSTSAWWRDEEMAAGLRVVERHAEAVALLAWAPRAPFETWVMPAAGAAPFGVTDPGPVAELARHVVGLLGRALREPPLDLVLVDGDPWRIEIVPRLAPPSTVEAASGVCAHGTFPEAAAEWLRTMRESG